jgi:hypothetical protein
MQKLAAALLLVLLSSMASSQRASTPNGRHIMAITTAIVIRPFHKSSFALAE